MYCSKCGAKNNDNANFCSKCGFPIKKVEEPNAQMNDSLQTSVNNNNSSDGYVNNFQYNNDQYNNDQYGGDTQNYNNNYNQGIIYAGFGQRLLAWLIDMVLLGVVNSIIMIIVFATLKVPFFNNSLFSNSFNGGAYGSYYSGAYSSNEFITYFASLFIASSIVGLIGTVIQWLYYALMESSKHQATLGKIALGLIVTDVNGQKISFGRASGRYFGKILSYIIMYVGFIMAAFTDKKQALHDMLAGTLVVKG
jgi:uncharacterized RDD family membrane protein YckC